jgi:hypothetical protein
MKPPPAAFPGTLGVYAQCIQHHSYAGQPTKGWLILGAVIEGKQGTVAQDNTHKVQ